jgi:hypothetical protein
MTASYKLFLSRVPQRTTSEESMKKQSRVDFKPLTNDSPAGRKTMKNSLNRSPDLRNNEYVVHGCDLDLKTLP